jgi:hypothetical protein
MDDHHNNVYSYHFDTRRNRTDSVFKTVAGRLGTAVDKHKVHKLNSR